MSIIYSFILLLLSFPVIAAAQTVLVIQTKGTVERTLTSNIWTIAKRADTLRLGDKLRTARSAQSIVRFEDGTILRIAERTEIHFVSPSSKNNREPATREVAVLKGALTYDVKANPNQPFRFRSPTAVAAIKGTTGSFTTDGKATNFVVENSDAKEEVAEFETERGEKKSIGIGEVAVLNRSGKLTIRQILEEERRAIQNEINQMRRAVEEELRNIKEEVEQMRRDIETQHQAESDSVKNELQRLKQDQEQETDELRRELEKTKEEIEQQKRNLRELFDK
ncbi:MAG: FecR domain-containing protein [Chlorobiales bacterium]